MDQVVGSDGFLGMKDERNIARDTDLMPYQTKIGERGMVCGLITIVGRDETPHSIVGPSALGLQNHIEMPYF